jgi:hypothetical protein
MDGGHIDTNTGGDGHGGTIFIDVERLILSGEAEISSASGIQVGNQLFVGSGQGGIIDIRAQQVDISDGGVISARSVGEGDAGNIRIQASETFVSRNGAVTTETTQAGGGQIDLRAGFMVHLIDSAITTTVGGGTGNAGDITMGPRFIILDGSRVVANAFEGRGGNIRMVADVFLASPGSIVDASSTLGISGTVDIRAPVNNLSGAVAPLALRFAPVEALLRDRCAARLREGTVSSLVERGRDGVPATPDGVLPSRIYSERSVIGSPAHKKAIARPDTDRRDHNGHAQARLWVLPKGSVRERDRDCLTR